MPTSEFASYLLRTLDPDAATAFYDAVVGHHGDGVWLLHENARARGARPHWLGVVDVAEPEPAIAALVADGGERLGPRPGGGTVLFDPGRALLAVGPCPAPSAAGVVWHVLRTGEPEAAAARYARVFGWALGASVEVGGTSFRTFAGPAEAAPAGVIGGLGEGVHPHWLHFFGVASLEAAVDAARTRGANLLPITVLPDGRRAVVGDDPQGAAFGLLESPSVG